MASKFLSKSSIEQALKNLRGTADPSLKVWLTLKAMGLDESTPVDVRATEENSGSQLADLFGYPNAPDEKKYIIPFSPTKRFLTMRHDAYRSQIQTAVKEWGEGGRQTDPREFLSVTESANGAWRVTVHPGYPNGLGYGRNGFAREDGQSVGLPIRAWASWMGRQVEIPGTESDPIGFLVQRMLTRLNIKSDEKAVIFRDDNDFQPTFVPQRIDDGDLNAVVNGALNDGQDIVREFPLDRPAYARRLATIRSDIVGPRWLNCAPAVTMQGLISAGAKAVLLYGPPRTGKTRAIDQIVPRTDATRETIQIHDGWGYEHLMLGLKSDGNGGFAWSEGPLLQAIRAAKKYIVLEEANRTQLAQSLGETFSLIEGAYRGKEHSVTLRDGTKFHVSPDTIFFFTLNTLDKSTEEVDDALLGRMDAVEFLPRVEELHTLLAARNVSEEYRHAIAEFFAGVKEKYPLGHGYFSDIATGTDLGSYYLTRIRPVIQKHFNYRRAELTDIDLLADRLLRGKVV